MGFHVDTTGNVWLGSGTTGTTLANAIVAGPPNFYVTTTGNVVATAGTIGGWTLGNTTITATSGSDTLTLNSNGTISANYSSAVSGYQLNADGSAEFNGPILNFGKATGTPSNATNTSIKLGDAILFSRDEGSAGNHLFSTKPFVVMADGDEDNPSLTIQGDFQKMGFFLVTQTDFNFDTFKLSNGNDDIWSVNSNSTTFTILGNLTVDGGTLTVNGDSGGSNQFLGYNGAGSLGFHTVSGSSHPDSDHSFAATSHSHSESDISNIGSHTHASNASWLNNDHGSHTSLGASGGTFGSSSNAARFDHSHSSSNVSVSAGAVTSNAGYLLRTLSASNNVITYNRSDFGSSLKMNSQRPTSNNTSSVGISTIEYNEMHSRSGNFTFVYGANLGSSSQEIKTDITDLDLGLDFINNLSPKKYKYVTQVKEDDGKYGFGFIAEDIEQVLIDNSETDSKLFVDGRDDYSSYGRCAHELTCTCEDEDCCSYPTETYNADTGEHTSTEGCMFDAKCVQPCCTDIAGATIDGINYVHATEAECEEEFIVSQKHPSLKYDELIAPAVKAIQELSTQISDLTARVEALEG